MTPESLVEAVKGAHLKVSVTEHPSLEHKHVEFLARLSFQMIRLL
jgi:hypothetical protein